MFSNVRKVFVGITAFFFIAAGSLHFLRPAAYLRIMPRYIPWHPAMVEISGAAEIAGGIGLLIPSLRRPAGWGLVALLIAVFPANVYMATNSVPLGNAPLSPVLLGGCRCRQS